MGFFWYEMKYQVRCIPLIISGFITKYLHAILHNNYFIVCFVLLGVVVFCWKNSQWGTIQTTGHLETIGPEVEQMLSQEVKTKATKSCNALLFYHSLYRWVLTLLSSHFYRSHITFIYNYIETCFFRFDYRNRKEAHCRASIEFIAYILPF